MHVLDDPTVSARVARFLGTHGERWPSTPAERIRRSASADGPDGPLAVVPDELVAVAVAFEERYGGLAYRLKTDGNHMEYGLEGPAYFRWTSDLGWMFPAALDGAWTWGVDVLLDGRTAMAPGNWPYRLIDRTIEQRLEKHALLAEVRRWPHVTLTYETATLVSPTVTLSGVPEVREATGPADRLWYDGAVAACLSLRGWPAGRDRWVLRCFSRTRSGLSGVLDQLSEIGELDDWCSICGRALRPSMPSYVPQGGEPGLCLPSVHGGVSGAGG
ncbi:hypothetical protein ACGFH8_03270 [Micromonospora sp. NPDC049175]|uniref:hypothetical protein n=1 Tax=Micromonospora sp. NPDC049175 TaxID=3364266 RepID=UPI0037138CA2